MGTSFAGGAPEREAGFMFTPRGCLVKGKSEIDFTFVAGRGM
jgi:hypothetical protein